MKKPIRIFKSLEEQEQYHKMIMSHSSIEERFRRLNQMQQMSILLHPSKDKSRKIQIRKWTS